MSRWRMPPHLDVQLLAFIVAYCGVVAQADKDVLDPRLQLAAIGVGCGAVLALKRRPGQ